MSQQDQLRALVPGFALVVAVVAASTDPVSAPVDLLLAALPVAAFALWAYLPRVPLAALVVAVLVPVVLAQHDGDLEPLLFEGCLLAFVVGRWAPSLAPAIVLGLAVMVSPIAASLVNPSEIGVGTWTLGMVFPWIVGRAMVHQRELALQLDATRGELAQQALLAERRQIARDVHDSVGHGVAALMLQVTSARHVLHRDPAAAEEALRSAEEVGRRSMQELRRTVALLRRDDEPGIAPPPPKATDIAELVDQARAGGLDVELQTKGNLDGLEPSVGVALYRIAQEAVGNAARHSPRARTRLGIDVANGEASLVAETTGTTVGRPKEGYGLVGMRERATALGGQFAAGPTPEGWRVSCQLPLEGAR